MTSSIYEVATRRWFATSSRPKRPSTTHLLLATQRFGVTNERFGRLWQLTLLTCCSKLVALLFLPLVPRSAAFGADDERSSPLAGGVVLACFVGGLTWALVQIGLSM